MILAKAYTQSNKRIELWFDYVIVFKDRKVVDTFIVSDIEDILKIDWYMRIC